jgi:peptidoglycan/LPS O-acetylase OafA/YrhL
MADRNPSPSHGHIAALDGLRGIAILLVLALHADDHAGGVLPGAAAGWVGVDLFFALSGFLITGILIDARGGPHYYRNFYARRSLRILPAFGLFLLLRWALPSLPLSLAGPLGGPELAALLGFNLNHLYVADIWALFRPLPVRHDLMIGQAWSLAIEEHFYLFWPFVVASVGRSGLLRACGVLLAGSLLFRCVLALSGADWSWSYFATPARLDGLAAGAAVATLGVPRAIGLARRVLPLSLLALAVAATWQGDFSPGGPAARTVGYSLLALAFASVVAFAADPDSRSPIAAVGRLALLRWLGKYSYAAYLYHQPILLAAVRLVFGSPRLVGLREAADNRPEILLGLACLAGTIATFGAAWLSWHLWESRWLALKRYFPR